MGPGFEGAGTLYDERLASLEDLREYATSGRHPKEELLAIAMKPKLIRTGSTISRLSSATGSIAA